MNNWELVQLALTENIKLKSTHDDRVISFSKDKKRWECYDEDMLEVVEFDDWYSEDAVLSIHNEVNTSNLPLINSVLVGKICIVRTYSAGVFYGKIIQKIDKEVILEDARRIYYWEGAATLSQLAMEGTKKPEGCKFPRKVRMVILTEVIEIILMTKEAISSLDGVKTWEIT